MKQTPEEKKIYEQFLPGKVTKDGLIGDDDRHIHDIIEDDRHILNTLGITNDEIADQLQVFIDEGKKGLEDYIEYQGYTIRIRWSRGMLPCPFGDPPLIHKITAYVKNNQTGQEISFTQLGVHLIKKHSFFGGKGSKYRIEPDNIKKFLNIN